MLSVHCLTFNAFQENTYVLFDETGDAVIIDPGCSNRAEERELSEWIADRKLTPRLILLTHSHIDHILGAYFTKDKYRIPLCIHKKDEQTLRSGKIVASMYGIDNFTEVEADQYVSESETVNFGHQKLSVLFLPGHAPGHVGYYHSDQKFLIGGDVLFRGSVGRTDLPGGDFDTLIESIHQKLFTLPDDVVVYPGHGPETTIGEEKVSNPFCALSLK
jgi:glyoxylase-like metal-dependent hydrolase (beta-lactamase superfamily II)